MLNKIKKSLVALSVLCMSTTYMPKSQAGLFLLPAGVGLVVIIIGAAYDRPGLILLDETENDQIQELLTKKYPEISNELAQDLSSMLTDKISDLDSDLKGKVEIKLDEDTLKNLLEAHGVLDFNKDLADTLLNDLV